MRLQNLWPAAMLIAVQASAMPLVCLKDKVEVAGPAVSLRDLVEPGVQALALGAAGELMVGSTPRPGNLARLQRDELDRLLAARFPGLQVDWCGARQVEVRAALQHIPGREIAAKAADDVARQLQPAYPSVVVRPDGELPDVDVRPGSYELVLRRPEACPVRARMLVRVDILMQGTVVRSVAVPLALAAQGRAWFARHDLAAGARLAETDVELRMADLLAQRDMLAETEPVLGERSAVALRAGQPVRARDVAGQDEVMLGDTVRVLAGTGAVRIELTGAAAARAGRGERVLVRTGTGDAIEARVQSKGVVVIE
jgi:flagella basal body P-ring formation protein FlgA